MGHEVLHAYSTSFQSPKGDFTKKSTDENLEILPIANKEAFNKYSIFKRRKQEIEYAEILITRLKQFKPDVILIGNTPLFVQDKVQQYCLNNGIRFIYWCQDIYAIAIEKIARKKIGILGWPVWSFFYALEKKLLRKSDAIISITEDFDEIFANWGIQKNKIVCIPNWAPLSQISLVPKNNSWSVKHQLQDKFCIVYSGTLGLKHNPSILANTAKLFKNNSNVAIVVISEGIGADYLQEQKKQFNLDNLHLFPFQSFSDLSNVLGTANVLVAILEEDAGIFSVPSKVLTYLCSQKPIVLAVPENNLSAKIIKEYNAGLYNNCNDFAGFYSNLEKLFLDEKLRNELGNNGRKYAETHFIIETLAQKFISVLSPIS